MFSVLSWAFSRHGQYALLSSTLLLSAACGDDALVPRPDANLDDPEPPGAGNGDRDQVDDDAPWIIPDAPDEPVEVGPDLCQLRGSEVVVLGDSYIALDPAYLPGDTHPFVTNLESHARSAGALAADDSYRRYAQSGASLAYSSLVPAIPTQLDKALAEDPNIKLIIMDGGGNDVLVNNRACLDYKTEAELLANETCVTVVDKAIEIGQAMFDKAIAAGVGAVVYFFYPHLPGLLNGGIGAGLYPNTVLDYASPRVQALCEGQTQIPCYFIDLRGPFDADGDGVTDPGLINIDGIHPSAEGLKIMAAETWDVMQENCLASELVSSL